MTVDLSHNEKEVLRLVFADENITISDLMVQLTGKLFDKKGNIVTTPPDSRYISKLKSKGLDKVTKSLENLANGLILDYSHEKLKKQEFYNKKLKGILKGFDFRLNTYVYLIYTFKEGSIAWYHHDSMACEECHHPEKINKDLNSSKCESVLLLILQERKLKLPKEYRSKSTEKKAEWILKLINKEI
ncbi:MAG: hypothetical protein ACXAC7_04845 [Candidatus Hodarchaeales archaeon]|jgi:hypothetical protein